MKKTEIIVSQAARIAKLEQNLAKTMSKLQDAQKRNERAGEEIYRLQLAVNSQKPTEAPF